MGDNSSTTSKEGRHILPAQFRAGEKEAKTFDWALGALGSLVAIGGGILSFVAGVRGVDKTISEWDAKRKRK